MDMVNWRGGAVYGNFLGIRLLVFERALLGMLVIMRLHHHKKLSFVEEGVFLRVNR